MKKYVRASGDFLLPDDFLATEHALDTAVTEAEKAMNIFKARGEHMPESMMREIFEECTQLKRRLRTARKILNTDYSAIDTYQTMMEDQSRYLED